MGNKRKPAQGPAARSKKKRFTKGPKQGKSQPAKQQDVPLPSASDVEQEEYEVEDEDLEFVQQHAASLGFLTDLDTEQLNRAVKDKQKAAAAAAAGVADSDDGGDGDDELNSDEDAEEYERKPRAAEQVQKASSRGLPVKTPTGEVVYQPTKKQQQQLQSAKIQVEGVTVQDTLQLEQQMQKAAAKEAAAAADAERQAAVKQQHLLRQQLQAQAAKDAAVAGEDAGALPSALLSLMSIQDQQQRREALKQQMALAAQHLLAEPDKHVKQGLRLLLGCAADRDGHVVRLALLSMLAVFRDVLPGYRIRSLSEEEQEMRVSKEVAALREFEQALLRSYQAYLKTLLAAATAKAATGGSSSSSVLATARIAVRCMGQLLVTRPGFNYSSDLLQALVPLMVHSDVQIREEACSSLQQLLREDIQGKTSLEAVQLVADLVRKKKCSVPPLVVSSLLVLRFEQVTPTAQGGEGAGAKGGSKKVSKSRKKRKKSEVDRDFEEGEAAPDAAELAILQSQMLEALFEIFFRVLKHCSGATANHTAVTAATDSAAAAAANGNHSNGDTNNSSGSSAAVLVQPWPAARVHKKFPLLQPCLEGLGRYSHLISVEYFNDLMTVLQQLLAAGALPVRERLGVLLAALDILKGQGEALTIDRRAFYNHLYQMLLLVPLNLLYEAPESTAAAGGGLVAGGAAAANGVGAKLAAAEQDDLEDKQALQAVTVSLLGWEAAAADVDSSSSSSSREVVPTSVLLLRCLEQQLLGVKQTDMARLAAFTKRLAELMLSSSTAEAVGAACLMWRLIKRYNKLVCQFEWEGGAPVGGRQYDADCFDPSEAGGMAAALWELTLLTRHYHPHVAAAAKALLALTPGGSKAAAAAGDTDDGTGSAGVGINSVITGAAGPHELAGEYEAIKRGGFRPPPAVPAGFKVARGGAAAGSSRAGMVARQRAAAATWCQDLQQAVSAAAAADKQEVASAQQQRQQQQPGKNKKHKQQPQAPQQQCLPMQELSTLADVVDWHGFEAALQQHYQLSKQYHQNQQLQHELALTAKKVELFREHLIQKREQQQQEEGRGAKKRKQQR